MLILSNSFGGKQKNGNCLSLIIGTEVTLKNWLTLRVVLSTWQIDDGETINKSDVCRFSEFSN